jgi:hypothetical protein
MLKRIALALIASLWASLAFGQAPAQQFQQGLIGSGNSGYPPGSTAVSNASTGTTAGVTLVLPASGTIGQFTYLCGFSVSPGSATAAITLNVQVTNVPGGPLSWFIGAPVTAAGTTGATLAQTFTPCIRSNVVNQQIGLTVGALGTGGVNQTANMWGYTQ